MLKNSMYQISDTYIGHYFGENLIMNNSNPAKGRIKCSAVERDIIQEINEIHDLDKVWKNISIEYGIDLTDQNTRTIFEEYAEKLKKKGIISAGKKKKRIWGKPDMFYPLYLSIELTNRCNFKCTHCYKEAGPKCENYIDMDIIRDIINTLGDEVYSIDITGGEATLHPNFEEIISNIKVPKLNLLTNGSNIMNISKETLKRFSQIQVSLYGYSDREYKDFTNTDAFKIVCQGLERLVKLQVDVTVAITLRKNSIAHIQSYYELLSQIGVRQIRFGLAVKIGRNKTEESDWDISIEEAEQIEEKIENISKRFPKIKTYNIDVKRGIKPALKPRKEYSLVCDAGKTSICISELGKIRPCTMLPSKYFEQLSWKEYKSILETGQYVDYSENIRKCAKELEREKKTIDSICNCGFDYKQEN